MKERLINNLDKLAGDKCILVIRSNSSFAEEVCNRLRQFCAIEGIYSLNAKTFPELAPGLDEAEVENLLNDGSKLLAVPALPTQITQFNQLLHEKGFDDYYFVSPLFWIGKRSIYNHNVDVNIDEIVDILTNEEKECFLRIMEIRGNKSNDVTRAYEAIMQKNYFGSWRYAEYLNRDVIKTVYSGGLGVVGVRHFPYLSQNIFPKIEHIYAFDPDKTIFEYCYPRNFLETLKPKVEVIHKALSEGEDSLPFSFRRDKSFNGSGKVKPSSDTKVPSTSIDEFTLENDLSPDLIQLTIMGHELKALKGGARTISSHRPQVVIYGFWDALMYLNSIVDDYVFRFGFYSEGQGYLIFYAIPRELYLEPGL